MTIIRIETDEWDMTNNIGVSVDHPDLDFVLVKLNQLNGRTMDSLTIFKNNDEFLNVGDGSENICVVTLVTSDKTLELSNGSLNKEKVTVSIGGQDGEVPKYMLIRKETAKKAVEYFFEYNAPHPELNWEEWDGTC